MLGNVACIRLAGQATLGLGLRADGEGEGGRDEPPDRGGPACSRGGRLEAWVGTGLQGSSSGCQGRWGGLGLPSPRLLSICCLAHLEARPLVTD